MLRLPQIQGAIFDVDDTLLSNYPKGFEHGLHEYSRLAAAHEVGRRRGSERLKSFTLSQCTAAFRNAKVHTLESAIWQMLLMAGEVNNENVEPDNPLLKEMMELKEVLHEELLRTKGREVPGASHFVQMLAHAGLDGKMAIASTACRRDIDIFLEMSKLERYFPDSRIISRERFTFAKPNPEAYNLAFATTDLPEEARQFVVAFEDDPRGIMSAKAAGLFTCAITTRYDKKALASLEIAPDLIADTYSEFESLLA